jgi:hypothetical protein
MAIETTTLNNGKVVLAQKDRHGYFGAVTYVNNMQAYAKAARLRKEGIAASVYIGPWSRVRYIAIA